MNLFSRLQGVFFNPQATFKQVAEKPAWVGAMIVVLVAVMAFAWVTSPLQQRDQAQLMEDNVKMRERVGDERFEEMLEGMRNPTLTGRIIGTSLAPVMLTIGFLVSSLFLMVMGRMTSSQGRYLQIFSAVIHANVIDKILGNAVRLFIMLPRKSMMQASTGLSLFFPNLEATSTAYIVLTQIDLFQLWMFGVLAVGLAHIFKIELRKALIVSYVFWLLKTALTIGVVLFGMSFMR